MIQKMIISQDIIVINHIENCCQEKIKQIGLEALVLTLEGITLLLSVRL